MTEELSLDTVMARRFALVEEVGIITGKHKVELAPLNEELGLCETFIKDHMLKSGLQQAKTDAGMAFFISKDSVTVEDMDTSIRFMLDAAPPPDFLPDPSLWQRALDHMYAHGMWGLLNKALNKTAVKELLEATPPIAPETIGVKFSSYKDLSWRRGKGA
jgi:hypothetical protein